jgi:hypothetical protein
LHGNARDYFKYFLQEKITLKCSTISIAEYCVKGNDIKLFAQADCENEIDAYVTSDSESEKMYNALKQNTELSFSFFDIKIPCHEAFGFLPLK